MDKIAIASTKQIIAINVIEKDYGLKRLTPELCELALLRLDNPTAPMDFFAEKQGVTKSCINHRFRRLISLSEDLNAANDGRRFKMENSYIVHLHTEYSFWTERRGFPAVERWPKRLKIKNERGRLTDHGNLYGVYSFTITL